MASHESENQSFLLPEQVFSKSEIQELVERIKASGELGRSKIYASLLEFLVNCSVKRKSPKEIEIAIEALGKGADFDVSQDSTVRVYVHQLRKKLDNYYRVHEPDAAHHIVIPKGQYAISAVAKPKSSVDATLLSRVRETNPTRILLAIAIILLLGNLTYSALIRNGEQNSMLSLYLESSIWADILDDDLPILLVMGDYYIFGELNDNGNIGRMVRDFTINSREDLEERHFSDWETTRYYQDLDLSYMPEGSAYALARIIPILGASGKRFQITMMSDVTTADLRENHIIYLGYISAMGKLSDMVFAASSLQVGRSFDELIDIESGRYYTSDAGLPEEGQQFRDYGFFSTFPVSSENQVIVVGGMRDAGLMYTAQALSDQSTLAELEELLSSNVVETPSLEALYEVFGVDRMHFDGRLIYSNQPDPDLKWRQSLTDF